MKSLVVPVSAGLTLVLLALAHAPQEVILPVTVVVVLVAYGLTNWPGRKEPAPPRPDAARPPTPTPAPAPAALVGTLPWGAAIFADARGNSAVLVLLPIEDPAAYDAVPEFPRGMVNAVVVLNAGTEGALAGSRVASRAGVTKVYAADPTRPIDRGVERVGGIAVRPIVEKKAGGLVIEPWRHGVALRWEDERVAIVGERIPAGTLIASGATYAVGALSAEAEDEPEPPLGRGVPKTMWFLEGLPGVDVAGQAQAIARMGISAVVVKGGRAPETPKPTGEARTEAERGRKLGDEGRFQEAEAVFRRAVALDPQEAAYVADLGWTLSQQGRDADAIALYTGAIARGGPMELLRFNRGNCRQRTSDFAGAVEDYARCVELLANWHEARMSLASALNASGDRVRAEEQLTELRRRDAPHELVAMMEEILG